MKNLTIRITDSTKEKLEWLKKDQQIFWGDKTTYSEIIRIAIHQYWLQQNAYAWDEDPETTDPKYRHLKDLLKSNLLDS